MSVRLFYASDIHGSDRLWRKFINAAAFYGAEVLIMGGDLAGKAVIPIIRRGSSYYAPALAGERAFREDELPALERRIRGIVKIGKTVCINPGAPMEKECSTALCLNWISAKG